MGAKFDPGYRRPYATLARDYPGEDVYPADSFRTEWGPIFHSVYGQGGGSRHIDDEAIAAYRNRWLDTLAARNELQAIISLGQLADQAYQMWKATPAGADASTARTAAFERRVWPPWAAAQIRAAVCTGRPT